MQAAEGDRRLLVGIVIAVSLLAGACGSDGRDAPTSDPIARIDTGAEPSRPAAQESGDTEREEVQPEEPQDIGDVEAAVSDRDAPGASASEAAIAAESPADASADRDGVEGAAAESDLPDEPLDQRDSSETAGGSAFDSSTARSGETLVAASFDSTCAVRPDGDLWCWGRRGLPRSPAFSGFDDVVAVTIGDSSAGEFHACALHGDGRVSCWGDVLQGQIGDGTTNSATWPRRIDSLSDVVAISAGSHTNCAIHAGGSVSCWGWRAGVPQTIPRRVSRLNRVVSIAVGWHQSCAVRDDGRVFCWPHDHVDKPQGVPGLSGAVAVSVGDRSACVVHGDGGVSCWGENNAAGQLGDGTTTARPTPERLAGIAGAVAVTVSVQSEDGDAHACAARADGSVSCWGSNGFGQLGDGTTES